MTSNKVSISDFSMYGTNCSKTKLIEFLKKIGAFVNKLMKTSIKTWIGFFGSSTY
jgi:hypothetical protein